MTLVYSKTRVTRPNFLFAVGITRRGVIALLALLASLLLFLKPFLNGLEHGCHISHLLIAPKLLVGLPALEGLPGAVPRGLPSLSYLRQSLVLCIWWGRREFCIAGKTSRSEPSSGLAQMSPQTNVSWGWDYPRLRA